MLELGTSLYRSTIGAETFSLWGRRAPSRGKLVATVEKYRRVPARHPLNWFLFMTTSPILKINRNFIHTPHTYPLFLGCGYYTVASESLTWNISLREFILSWCYMFSPWISPLSNSNCNKIPKLACTYTFTKAYFNVECENIANQWACFNIQVNDSLARVYM